MIKVKKICGTGIYHPNLYIDSATPGLMAHRTSQKKQKEPRSTMPTVRHCLLGMNEKWHSCNLHNIAAQTRLEQPGVTNRHASVKEIELRDWPKQRNVDN